MKMMRTMAIICLLLTIAISFNGCDFTISSASDLIRPPKLTGSNGELQQTFEADVSERGSIILKSPSEGDYISSYILYDLDNDSVDEAIVFYCLESDESNIYMHLLDYIDEEWVSIVDISGDGADVVSIDFYDLNGDGYSEILVSYSILDSVSNKKLYVYSSNEDNGLVYSASATSSYTEIMVIDADLDGYDEIAIAYLDSTSEEYTSNFRLLKMSIDDGTISTVGETQLCSLNTGFANIASDVHDGICYFYIDEVVSGSLITEIVYWDENNAKLVSPIDIDILTLSSSVTARSLSIICQDINDDGIIEIPLASELNGSVIVNDSVETTQSLKLITWSTYNDDEFNSAFSCVIYLDVGFYVSIQDDMIDYLYVEINSDQYKMFFYELNDDDETELLFTITSVLITDDEAPGFYIATGRVYSLYGEITEYGSSIGLTKTDIINSVATI